MERYQRSLRFPICSWYLHHRHLSGGLLRFRSNTSESAATLVSLLPLSSPTTRGNTNQATRTRTGQLEPDTESGNRTMFQHRASPMEVRPCHPTHTDHYDGAITVRVEFGPHSTNLRSTMSPSPHIQPLQPLVTRAVSRGDNTGS